MVPLPGGCMTHFYKVVNITTSFMERAISAADANRKFSLLLREVKEGRTYVVTTTEGGGPHFAGGGAAPKQSKG